jgi:hypothetical protein
VEEMKVVTNFLYPVVVFQVQSNGVEDTAPANLNDENNSYSTVKVSLQDSYEVMINTTPQAWGVDPDDGCPMLLDNNYAGDYNADCEFIVSTNIPVRLYVGFGVQRTGSNGEIVYNYGTKHPLVTEVTVDVCLSSTRMRYHVSDVVHVQEQGDRVFVFFSSLTPSLQCTRENKCTLTLVKK